VTYLLDTDHISILQRQSGPEFVTLMAHIAQQAPTELHLNQPIEANPFAIPPPSAPKMPRRRL